MDTVRDRMDRSKGGGPDTRAGSGRDVNSGTRIRGRGRVSVQDYVIPRETAHQGVETAVPECVRKCVMITRTKGQLGTRTMSGGPDAWPGLRPRVDANGGNDGPDIVGAVITCINEGDTVGNKG